MTTGMEFTFLSTQIRILWRLLESHKIDYMSLCRQCGLDPALANDPRARYPIDRVAEAWMAAAEITGIPSIGLEAGKFYRATDFHALGYAFLASSTLRTALNRLVRYGAICSPIAVHVDEDEQSLSLCSSLPSIDPPASIIMEDCRLSLILAFCRVAAEEGLDPISVTLAHPEPKDTAPYYGLFRCPVTFGGSECRLNFSIKDAGRPFSAANRDLARVNDSVLVGLLRTLQEENLISKVKSAIVEELPSGEPAAETIAKSVFMSTRSLQRKLAEEGTTYTKLLQDVRFELAEKYIADDKYPITEVSYLLGFSDTSVFSRAFKRWSGHPPGHFRH